MDTFLKVNLTATVALVFMYVMSNWWHKREVPEWYSAFGGAVAVVCVLLWTVYILVKIWTI